MKTTTIEFYKGEKHLATFYTVAAATETFGLYTNLDPGTIADDIRSGALAGIESGDYRLDVVGSLNLTNH